MGRMATHLPLSLRLPHFFVKFFVIQSSWNRLLHRELQVDRELQACLSPLFA